MPQLDISFFAPQILWLLIFFIICYLINAKLLLPTIEQCIQNREKKIEKCHIEAQQLEEIQMNLASQIESLQNNQDLLLAQMINDATKKAEELIKGTVHQMTSKTRVEIHQIKQQSMQHVVVEQDIAECALEIEEYVLQKLLAK